MCTAVTYKTKDLYFGRTLDLDYSYNETVTITPRKYPFVFRQVKELKDHYAMIGMAFVFDNYPLYYDAINEKGLCMAGLNFPDNAYYKDIVPGKDNVAPFEFIPWVLGQCSDISDVRKILSNINIVNINFNDKLKAAPLHWIIADKNEALTIEQTKEGLKIYDNPVGVLTNNPPFDFHMYNLNNYMTLSKNEPVNTFSDKINLKADSRGMGAMGLPGDLSATSRFIKASFTKLNSVSGESEEESVSQFFHILGSVEQQMGCIDMGNGRYERTIYTSCCNANKGVYYYTTYENSCINGIDMHKENLDGEILISYELDKKTQLNIRN